MVVRSHSIKVSTGPLSLEGILALPQGPHPLPAVVACHPHPLYGGDMNSHVLQVLCSDLARLGIACLRFNFRGVGRSDGAYDGGIGEVDDLRETLSTIQRLPALDPARIGVAGYSFGATIAIAVASQDSRVKALAAISPPLEPLMADRLQSCTAPCLLVSGDQDQFTPSDRLQCLAASLGDRARCLILPGGDHFWGLGADEVAHAVGDFFASHLR